MGEIGGLAVVRVKRVKSTGRRRGRIAFGPILGLDGGFGGRPKATCLRYGFSLGQVSSQGRPTFVRLSFYRTGTSTSLLHRILMD